MCSCQGRLAGVVAQLSVLVALVDGAGTLFQVFGHELNGLGATVASPKTSSIRDVDERRLRAVRRRTTTTSTSCARVRVAVMITRR